MFCACFAFSDYLRANLLSGFPWNLWAYSTSSFNEILQIINLIGLYAYNLFVITIFCMPVIFFFKISKIKKLFFIISTCLIIVLLFIYGNYKVNENKEILESSNDKIYVKIISPNFDLRYGLKDKIMV